MVAVTMKHHAWIYTPHWGMFPAPSTVPVFVAPELSDAEIDELLKQQVGGIVWVRDIEERDYGRDEITSGLLQPDRGAAVCLHPGFDGHESGS